MKDPKTKVTERELENGLKFAAHLVDKYGDDFWPIFDRVESELSRYKLRSKRLSKHLADYKEDKGFE